MLFQRILTQSGYLFAATILVMLSSLYSGSFAQDTTSNQTSYLIGTGNYNRTSYALGGVLCRIAQTVPELKAVGCKSVSGTSLQNIYDLNANGVDFAILESDWQEQGYTGSSESDFPDGPMGQLRRVFGLHEEIVSILVADASNYSSFEDLKGKRLTLGPNGTATRETFELLLKQKNWQLSDFEVVEEGNILKQIKAICEGAVDAVPLVTAFANASMVKALQECQLKSIPFSKELIGSLISQYGFYSYSTLSPEVNNAIAGHAGVLTVGSGLVTYDDMDDETVYTLVKAVFENLEQLKKMHPALHGLSRSLMLREDVSLPFHPGALRYYKEQGWK